MTLDVVVPSYNRSALLQRTIASLLAAPVPDGLEVSLHVVDNNSKDDTRSVVEAMQAQTNRRLHYHLETRQSSSYARNTGIQAGCGELIGFIDDDEAIDSAWYDVVYREFQAEAVSYIGGPYYAEPGLRLPAWLPPSYRAATGVHDPKPRAVFGQDHTGNLNSGNAVIRRKVFAEIGLYSEKLGRSGVGLLSEEDADLYRRIQAAGFHGVFVPELVIYHHVPAERMTKRYHRRWAFWRGVSLGVVDRETREAATYRFGIPQYRFGRVLRACPTMAAALVRGRAAAAFDQELSFWDLAGFIYGKRGVQIENFYK